MSKEILFIGPYRQSCGWGMAAKDYIRALSKTENNLSIKPIYLSNTIDNNIGHDLIKLEENKLKKHPDIVIQNMFPSFMDYIYGAKNIGLCFVESNHIEHTGWIDKMNLMDEVWAASLKEKTNLTESGVKIPIHIVPMPIDVKEFQNKNTELLQLPNTENCFIFYFIGEYITRKNITKLVLAYHREFRNNEPVKLVIKTNRSDITPQQLVKKIDKDINELKKTVRLYHQKDLYNSEFIITDKLTHEELLGLHNACNCLIIPSSGESLNRPCMEAMAAGNQIIITKNTGMEDLSYTENYKEPGVYLIDSYEVPLVVKDAPNPYLYTGNETWFEPSVISLQKCMRKAYKNKNKKHTNKQAIQKYTHKNIAKIMNKIL